MDRVHTIRYPKTPGSLILRSFPDLIPFAFPDTLTKSGAKITSRASRALLRSCQLQKQTASYIDRQTEKELLTAKSTELRDVHGWFPSCAPMNRLVYGAAFWPSGMPRVHGIQTSLVNSIRGN
jgi:hypothetical protein